MVIQRAAGRTVERGEGRGPTLKGELVIFGEGKLDAPDTHANPSARPSCGWGEDDRPVFWPRLERPSLAG